MNNLLISTLKCKINKSHLRRSFDFSYHTQKYSLETILNHILNVLKNGFVWRNITDNVHWNTIYKAFIKLSKLKIFEKTYIDMLKKYIRRDPNNKLRIQITDTSIIRNQYGRDKIKRNKYCNNKKVMKLSVITDRFGIPINVATYSGNIHDSKIIADQLMTNKYLISYIYTRKYSKYFLADKGYDSNNVRSILKQHNYKPLIAQNKRNIKDNSKLKKMSTFHKKIFRERSIVERFFGKLKRSYKRLSDRYDNYATAYESFLYLALCSIVMKQIN